MAGLISIQTEAEHKAALTRIHDLMNAELGTPEGSELDSLVGAVEEYESRTAPMGHPGPLRAIEFRMEQAGLCPDDLIPCIGSEEKVAEVLSGTRLVTPTMAFALQELLGIPAESLLGNQAVSG